MDSSGICVFRNKVSCQIPVCRSTCWQRISEVIRAKAHRLMNSSSEKNTAKVLAHLSNFLETENTPLRTAHDFDIG